MTNTLNPHTTCTLQLRKNHKTTENKFEVTMREAIDRSLSSFKGLNKQKVYVHLENSFKIRKQEIPCKIEEFSAAMEHMFGLGAKLIEIMIIKAVHERLPEFMFTPKRGTVIFKDYVDSLRAFLLQSA